MLMQPQTHTQLNRETDKPSRLFMPTNKAFFRTMLRSEILQWKLNKTPIWNIPKRNWLFKKLVARLDGKPFCVVPPCFFQEGNNTYIGKNFYCGTGFTCLDHGGVYIGDNVLIGPHVTICTHAHPKIAEQRIVRPFKNSFEPMGRGEIETLAKVTIGDNAWIASGCIICPGVNIGKNAVIGAGSIVTKDVPDNTIAFGNPCRVIRKITEEDRIPEERCKIIYDGEEFA